MSLGNRFLPIPEGLGTPAAHIIELPKGTIKVLTGKELTWDDEPIEIC